MSASPPPVAVDTNVIFSAMLRSRSHFADVLFHSEHTFYVCESMLVELFKHKEKIVRLSRVSEEEVIRLYHHLLRRVHLHKEDLISRSHWQEAHAFCHDIDAADTPHLALALSLDGLLWTGDKRLREGLQAKGFTRFFSPGG